jgi:hypothetical protein
VPVFDVRLAVRFADCFNRGGSHFVLVDQVTAAVAKHDGSWYAIALLSR